MATRLPYASRPLVLLVSLFLAWWLTPTAVKSVIRVSFFEFQAPFWTGVSYLRDLQDYWATRNHSKRELIEAGRDLARLNAAYEIRLQEHESLVEEVARLERLFDLPSLPDHRYEVARVVRRDLNSWWQQLVIRKGRNYGIAPGAAVIFSGGVVGRIKEVHAYTATVELVSSRTFRMAAHFEADARPVTYRGGINLPLHPPRGNVLNVPADLEVDAAAPRRLVSSRLGGIFPDGLTIGWVDKFARSTDGLFQEGRLRIDSDLLGLKEVAVLIPLVEGTSE